MKKLCRKPLLRAYAAALALWLLIGCAGAVKSLLYTAKGMGGQRFVPAEELEQVALVPPKDGREGWVVSSDSDPQLRWQCGGWLLETVTLEMETEWPTGSVAMYYRLAGQEGFSPAQILYADRISDTEYRFVLSGVKAEEIRIDPASQGGVFIKLNGLRLAGRGRARFVPDGRQAALLLAGPPVAPALWSVLAALKKKNSEEKAGMSILSACAAYAALLGFAAAWAVFGKTDAARTPFGAVSGCMVLLSAAGMLGVLRPVALALAAAGLICLAAAGYAAAKDKADALKAPGFICFAVAGGLLLWVLACLAPELWAWDEFSFWGTSVKLMKVSGGELYTTAQIGWPWPATQKPGLPVLGYWFGLWGDFEPWTAYFGYAVLLLAAGCAAAGGLKWRWALPAAVMGCLLPAWFTTATRLVDMSEAYLCLMGDVPLGMMMGGCVAAYFAARCAGQRPGMAFVLGLGALGLIKETGLALAMIVLAIAAFDTFFIQKSEKARHKLALCGGGLAAVLAPYLLWGRYIAAVTAADTSGVGGDAGLDQVTLMLRGLTETFGLAPRSEQMAYVLDKMGEAFWHRGICMAGAPAAALGVLGGLCLLGALGGERGMKKRPVVFFVLSCGAFAAWYLFNAFLYAFVIKETDRLLLSNFARYIYPCLMGLTMGGICLACAAGQDKPKTSLLRAAPAALALAMLWQTARMIPADKQLLGMSGAEFEARRAQRLRAESLAERFLPGEKAFVVGQGDDGLRWFQLCCDLLPAQVDYSFGGGQIAAPELAADPDDEHAMTTEEFDEYLRETGCGLVLLEDVDDVFVQSYGELFGDGLDAAQTGEKLYRRGTDGLFWVAG